MTWRLAFDIGGTFTDFSSSRTWVARGVALGYRSAARAREWYGVVIDPVTGGLDATATTAKRRRRR